MYSLVILLEKNQICESVVNVEPMWRTYTSKYQCDVSNAIHSVSGESNGGIVHATPLAERGRTTFLENGAMVLGKLIDVATG